MIAVDTKNGDPVSIQIAFSATVTMLITVVVESHIYQQDDDVVGCDVMAVDNRPYIFRLSENFAGDIYHAVLPPTPGAKDLPHIVIG